MSDERDRAVMVRTLAQEESEHRRRKHNRKREAACAECQGFALFAMHDLLAATAVPQVMKYPTRAWGDV